jgi:hypothetical protein
MEEPIMEPRATSWTFKRRAKLMKSILNLEMMKPIAPAKQQMKFQMMSRSIRLSKTMEMKWKRNSKQMMPRY